MTGRQSMVRQAVASVCIALPGVELGGTGTPSWRRTSSMRSRMMKTDWPAMGLAPEGNAEVMATHMEALTGDWDGAEAGVVGAAPGEEV